MNNMEIHVCPTQVTPSRIKNGRSFAGYISPYVINLGSVATFGASANSSPLTIFGGGASTVVAWYRADLGVGLNGSYVSSWADQSGNANTLVQAVSNSQPAYVAGAPGAAYINFNGSVGGLGNVALRGGALQLSAQPFEYFAVAKTLISMASPSAYILDFYGGNVCSLVQYSNTGMALYAGSALACNDAVTTNAIFVADAVFNGSSSTLSLNNGTPSTGNPGTNSPYAGGPISVGNYVGSGYGWEGYIYEIIILNRTATTAERTAIAAYFSALYGQP